MPSYTRRCLQASRATRSSQTSRTLCRMTYFHGRLSRGRSALTSGAWAAISFPQLHQLLILGRSRREKRGSGRAPGVEVDALPRLAWPKIGCLPGGSGGRLQHPSVEPKPSAIFSPSLLLIPRCILVQAGDKVCKAPTGMQEVWKSRAGQWRGIRAPLLR